jgi:hypothetical protein
LKSPFANRERAFCFSDMGRVFRASVGFVLILSAVTYVLYDAAEWRRAADIVDVTFRPLGASVSNARPGGIFLETDTYYWLSYADRISKGESWRIRYTLADNAPEGRPVHWSQSISWLLVAFGKARQWFTHETPEQAIERASVWLNPFLLCLFLCFIGVIGLLRIGSIPAGLFAVYLVTLGDVGWTYQPLRPGHQTLYTLFATMTLVALGLGGGGWVRMTPGSTTSRNKVFNLPTAPAARRWFIAAGTSTALCMWVSAVVSTMVLGMIFCGMVLLAIFVAPADTTDTALAPESWRYWGLTAGIGAAFFYLIEYFPHHLQLFRLEVNGPLYSLGVIGMGEGIYRLLKAKTLTNPRDRRTAIFCAVLFSSLAIAIPVAIGLGPPTWHALRDVEMQRLHNFIQEFYSFPRFAGTSMSKMALTNFGIIPFFVAAAFILSLVRKLKLNESAILVLSVVVTIGIFGFGYLQIRWLGLLAPMATWVATLVGIYTWQRIKPHVRFAGFVGVLVIALLLIQPVMFAQRRITQVDAIIQGRDLPKQLLNPALDKRLALALRETEGPGLRVMASLDLTPALHYFAESAAVGSYYWENLDGLHATTRFFGDGSGGEARKVAAARGLTHVVVQEGNSLENYFYFIASGKFDQQAATQTFAARLLGSEFNLPSWLQTTPALQSIGYAVYSYHGLSIEDRWRVYRIVPANLGAGDSSASPAKSVTPP